MGRYWQNVFGLAWSKTAKFYKVDTAENVMFFLIGLVAAFVALWIQSGNLWEALSKPLNYVLAALVAVALAFTINLLRAPALLSKEQDEKLASANAELAALRAVPEQPNMRNIKWMYARLVDRAHLLRKKGSSGDMEAFARECIQDHTRIFGPENGDWMTRLCSGLLEVSGANDGKAEALRHVASNLEIIATRGANPDEVLPDEGLNEYVAGRLKTLRDQAADP